MKTLIFFVLLISSSLKVFSQKEFMYGKMVKGADSLVGYFWIDNHYSQNGQRVNFKEDLNSNVTKRFQSREYDYFESDSLYLETFPAIPTVSGDILIMIPRIANGSIQLFGNTYSGGYMNLIQSETYFIKKDYAKEKIKKKNFKEMMQRFVGDDKALIEKIDKGELKYDDLIEIITTYNNNHPSS